MKPMRSRFSRARRRLSPFLVVLMLALSFEASADDHEEDTLEGTPEEDLSPGVRLRIVSCGYENASDLPEGNPPDDDDSAGDDDDSAGDDDDSMDDDDASPDDDDTAPDDDDSADDDDTAPDDDDSAAADDDDSAATSDDDDSAR